MTPHIAVVLGLGFGDEGKGTLVDWLVRRHAPNGGAIVVRHGGGAQAAHHVTSPEGKTHCFSQLGSGGLVPNTRTYLDRGMVIDPLALHLEAAAIAQVGVKNALSLLTIHPEALVVTPWHARLNRLRETLRLGDRHGSTGRGIGEARFDAERGLPSLVAGDALSPERLRQKARLVQLTKLDHADQLIADAERDRHPALEAALEAARKLRDELRQQPLESVVSAMEALLAPGRATISAHLPLAPDAHAPTASVSGSAAPSANGRCPLIVFEGAQGLLLDRDHGLFPHVSPTRSTVEDAEHAIAGLGLDPARAETWGVLRAYHTRHGAGPLPSGDATWTSLLPEPNNGHSPWQGPFRCGPFDAVLARYALATIGRIDRLAVNCVDRVEPMPSPAICEAWDLEGGRLDTIPAALVASWAGPAAGVEHPLTGLARAARPISAPVAGADLVAAIEAAIGRPIDLVGRGPRALDKVSP